MASSAAKISPTNEYDRNSRRGLPSLDIPDINKREGGFQPIPGESNFTCTTLNESSDIPIAAGIHLNLLHIDGIEERQNNIVKLANRMKLQRPLIAVDIGTIRD
jgi:hypothetical protein